MIIRNTELATAQEKFEEVEKQYKEVHARCSPHSLLDKLQGAANDADNESENLHQKLLSGEIELGEFIQKYRKQRILFHRRTLIRMAALTSLTTPG
jgi:ESCRT-I complex subunit VPS37